MRPRRLAAIVVAAGSVLGTLAVRRRHSRLRAHVDLYFDDGSTLPLGETTPDAELIFGAARDVLHG